MPATAEPLRNALIVSFTRPRRLPPGSSAVPALPQKPAGFRAKY